MVDKLISFNALRNEIERNFDMQDLYLPIHFLDIAENTEEGIVRCVDCRHADISPSGLIKCQGIFRSKEWFCADGRRK